MSEHDSNLYDLGNGEAMAYGTADDLRAAADYLGQHYPEDVTGPRHGPVSGPFLNGATPELMLLIALVVNRFSEGFLSELGKQAADGVAKRMGTLRRTRVWRKGKSDEYRIGVDDGSAATVAFTVDLPDEARLALLDLNVTADEVRGKLLRWDDDTSAWCPAGDK